MTNRPGASAPFPDSAPVREPEPACVASLLVTACAAMGLVVIVWAVYGSLDHDAFDVTATVITPVLAALGTVR